MPGGRETEFKLTVSGDDDFRALCRALGVAEVPAAVEQHNHFFDTPSAALVGRRLALRLREEAGRAILTAKGPRASGGDEAVSVRPEEELVLDSDDGAAILRGELDPLERLTSGVGEPLPPLVDELWVARGQEALLEVGAFRNWRARVGPLRVEEGGEGLELAFELDRTLFPGERVDFEIEVEVEEEQAELASRVLRALMARLGLEWRTTCSKAQRFRDALAAQRARG